MLREVRKLAQSHGDRVRTSGEVQPNERFGEHTFMGIMYY